MELLILLGIAYLILSRNQGGGSSIQNLQQPGNMLTQPPTGVTTSPILSQPTIPPVTITQPLGSNILTNLFSPNVSSTPALTPISTPTVTSIISPVNVPPVTITPTTVLPVASVVTPSISNQVIPVSQPTPSGTQLTVNGSQLMQSVAGNGENYYYVVLPKQVTKIQIKLYTADWTTNQIPMLSLTQQPLFSDLTSQSSNGPTFWYSSGAYENSIITAKFSTPIPAGTIVYITVCNASGTTGKFQIQCLAN